MEITAFLFHLRFSQSRDRGSIERIGSHNDWDYMKDEGREANSIYIKIGNEKGWAIVEDQGIGQVVFLPWLTHLCCFAGNKKRDRAASVPQGSFDGFSGPQHLL